MPTERSRNSSEDATRRAPASSNFSPGQIQTLSASVAQLLESTSKMRLKFEKEHRNCVPRKWSDERMKRALARSDSQIAFLQSIIKTLVGALCGCVAGLVGALALMLR